MRLGQLAETQAVVAPTRRRRHRRPTHAGVALGPDWTLPGSPPAVASKELIVMRIINIVLLIIGAACFALSTFGVKARVDLVPLGLLAWILVPLIAALQG